jgi:hypothetical protein
VARVFADRTNHHAESCRCGSLHLPSSSGDRASKIARPLDVGIDSHLENRHRRIFTRFLPASHPKKAATRQTRIPQGKFFCPQRDCHSFLPHFPLTFLPLLPHTSRVWSCAAAQQQKTISAAQKKVEAPELCDHRPSVSTSAELTFCSTKTGTSASVSRTSQTISHQRRILYTSGPAQAGPTHHSLTIHVAHFLSRHVPSILRPTRQRKTHRAFVL